ncbi:MAG: STAS domain-containing protein [Actinoplanes sp.]
MTTPLPLGVTCDRVNAHVAVLTITGELDRDTAPLVRAEITALQQDGCHRLVCDLTGLAFCDSGGMGLFVDTHRTTEAMGGWLRLAGTPPEIRKLFGVVALDRLLDFRDSTEAAL